MIIPRIEGRREPTYTVHLLPPTEALRPNKKKKLPDKDNHRAPLKWAPGKGKKKKNHGGPPPPPPPTGQDLLATPSNSARGRRLVFMFEDWRVKAIDQDGYFPCMRAPRRDLALDSRSRDGNRLRADEDRHGHLGAHGQGKTTTLAGLAACPGRLEMIGDDGGTSAPTEAMRILDGGLLKTEGPRRKPARDPPGCQSRRTPSSKNVAVTKYPYMAGLNDTSQDRQAAGPS